MKEQIQACFIKCKWLPWLVTAVGVITFVLGIFLSATIIKELWLCLSFLAIILGSICCFMVTR